MYKLLMSDESRLDILNAFAWYEEKRKGLGEEFEMCLEAGLSVIQSNPIIFQKRYKNFNIHFITRFPYGIHYFIDGNTIKVMGVFHTSRNPKKWVIRIKNEKY